MAAFLCAACGCGARGVLGCRTWQCPAGRGAPAPQRAQLPGAAVLQLCMAARHPCFPFYKALVVFGPLPLHQSKRKLRDNHLQHPVLPPSSEHLIPSCPSPISREGARCPCAILGAWLGGSWALRLAPTQPGAMLCVGFCSHV